ncbi:hypothetical protein E2562_017041 [Oryza meyeriana var. granulata]|uniref:Uncharacterized protein n=1 Tax=Oryza meyeriana var. granulata TaxID=110450 RepID=A0A6G1F8R2_9ORYZ|nr:hypothetical protein E2562_017041 [Oryza meyeriana var. granulata]
MDPAGAPWCDPHRGYGGYGVGSAMQAPVRQQSQQPRSDGLGGAAGTGGVLKRSLGQMERWQQQQRQVAAQQAMYLRSVRQRTGALLPMDIGAVLGGAASPAYGISGFSGFGGISPQPSSTLSSLTIASRTMMPGMQQAPLHKLQRQMMAVPAPQSQAVARGPAARPATASELVLLQELEKQLLGDDDEADAAGSACGSGITSSDWGNTIQRLNSVTTASSPSLPLPTAVNSTALLSRSPTNSSSSTASSSASSSPPISTASSRQLLSDAAAAIAAGNHTTAASHLSALKLAANPRGDAEQRLVAMMVAALSSRAGSAPSGTSQHLADLYSGEHRAACQLLLDVSPCFGVALHGANLAILDAVAGNRVIHLVDFDVSAAQHVALIKALADRRVPSTSLKVTIVADPTSPFTPPMTQALAATSERLKTLAQQAGIDFRFRAVSCRAAEIEASKLGCEPGEALAVNLAFTLSRVPDESVSPANPRDELLRRVRALGPRVVTLVEQELNTNTSPLAARFSDACAHYGAVLESLDATLSRDSAERSRVEAALANKVANAVGREGPDRVERCEVFGKWRARFGMAEFRAVAIGEDIAGRVRARLGPALPAFNVKLDNGRLGVGWMGRVVTVASAWR